jgi:hypothetical protein
LCLGFIDDIAYGVQGRNDVEERAVDKAVDGRGVDRTVSWDSGLGR